MVRGIVTSSVVALAVRRGAMARGVEDAAAPSLREQARLSSATGCATEGGGAAIRGGRDAAPPERRRAARARGAPAPRRSCFRRGGACAPPPGLAANRRVARTASRAAEPRLLAVEFRE